MVLLMLLVFHHASVLIFKHIDIVVFECFAIGQFAFQFDCCLFSRGRRLFHPGGLMLVATDSTVVVVVVVEVIVHTSVVCSCFRFLLKKGLNCVNFCHLMQMFCQKFLRNHFLPNVDPMTPSHQIILIANWNRMEPIC